MDLSSTLARAMALQEGWNNPRSIQFSNNNPGNIMDVGYYKQTGQFRAQNYASMDAGWSAMNSLLSSQIAKGLTLRELIGGKPGVYAGYAPKGHGNNDPDTYANNVAKWLDISPDVPLSQYRSVNPTRDLPAYGGASAPLPVSDPYFPSLVDPSTASGAIMPDVMFEGPSLGGVVALVSIAAAVYLLH